MSNHFAGVFFATFIFFIFFLTPVTSYAEIVPCGNGESDECSVCDLQTLANEVIEAIVVIGALLATLLFVNAGILYVLSPSNPGNIAKAHSIFTSTLVGFLIILGSWLIIDVIMDTLTGSDDWKNVLCVNDSS